MTAVFMTYGYQSMKFPRILPSKSPDIDMGPFGDIGDVGTKETSNIYIYTHILWKPSFRLSQKHTVDSVDDPKFRKPVGDVVSKCLSLIFSVHLPVFSNLKPAFLPDFFSPRKIHSSQGTISVGPCHVEELVPWQKVEEFHQLSWATLLWRTHLYYATVLGYLEGGILWEMCLMFTFWVGRCSILVIILVFQTDWKFKHGPLAG